MKQRMTFADNWNTLEQACLASVVRSLGDRETNWSIVCNQLKSRFAQIDRPGNWLTPESCEAQYKWLSDKYVKMEISCERPVNQIIQNLKQIGECESKPVLEQEKTYNELKKRLELIANNEVDSEIIMEFYEDACKRNREREEMMRKQGLKTDSPNVTKSLKPDNKTDGTSPTTTSPLLSSLLNNPPAVQYRPTLSTGSFIPNKTNQGTSRTTYERVHPQESSQRGSYSPNSGSQSSSVGERSSSFNASTVSPARKLDFQDPSTSATSRDHLSAAKEANKDASWNSESAKSDVNNLENINLIPTTEEFDPDILLQVIGDLQGKQVLEKVLDELAISEKESTIEKDLNTVTIPLEDAFVADSPAAKNNAVQILTLPAESKTASVLGSSAVNAEFESLGHQYAATEDVIIVEDDNSCEAISNDTNITGVEQPTPVDTAPMNSDSSISLTIDGGASETVSESKFDSEPLVEYLDTSAVEKADEEIVQTDERIEARLDVEYTKVDTVNKEETELVEEDENSRSTPKTLETHDTSDSGQPTTLPQTPSTEVEQATAESNELEVEQTKEIPKEPETKQVTVAYEAISTVRLEDTFDVANVPITDFEPTENVDTTKAETDQSTAAEESVEPAQVPEAEEAAIVEPVKISKPIPETEQIVDANLSLTTLATIAEESIATSTDEKLVDHKLSTQTEANENPDTEKAPSKNRRQLPRRRRSIASESNETPKIMKIDDIESTEDEEAEAKRVASVKESVNDSQVEVLDSELFIKTEDVEEPAVQVVQTSPTKTKSTNKNPDAKKPKPKASVSRRSSIRSQNQNLLAPKPEETMASPSTPSSSRMSDSAASKCKKSLVLSQQRLASQKYSSAFLKPISNKTVPGYEDLIYSPIDLHTIKKKIDTRVMKTVAEFERDVLLMILNAKMFNRVNPQVYNMAVEMQKEALREIQLTVKTLGEGVLLEIEDDITEKARKRQAVENLKREQKSYKRSSKPPTKDESMPAKRIKLEENEFTP